MNVTMVWRGVLRTVATHQGPLNVHVKMDSNLIKTTMQPVKVLSQYSVFSFLFYLLNYLLVSFFIVCSPFFCLSLFDYECCNQGKAFYFLHIQLRLFSFFFTNLSRFFA